MKNPRSSRPVQTVVVIFLSLMIVGHSFANTSPSTATEASVKAALEKRVKPNEPGVAVAVIKDGKLVSKAVAGRANLDYDIPVGPDTAFNIASNAKQFTAACILILEREKKLSLEEDFRKYLPDILKNNKEKITIRNLLNHTSGIRDVYDLWALQGKTWWQTFVGNDDAMSLLKRQNDLNFKPGEDMLYSNSNYILLAEIVEVVAKLPLKEFAKQRIFEPLGMTKTRFADNYMDAIPNRADAYGNFGGWKKYPWITNTYGDGALFTTIDDQVKWELHFASPKVWDAATNKALLAPLKTGNLESYGYGLMFDKYKGLVHSYHDGSTGAYNAAFDRFPSEAVSVIVMSNNGNVGTRNLSIELAQLVIDQAKLVEPSLGITETPGEGLSEQVELAGDYAFGDGSLIQIKDNGGVYTREIYGRDPIKLNRVSRSVFSYDGNDSLKIRFDIVDSKATALTIVAATQDPQTASRLTTKVIEKGYAETVGGKFIDPETGTKIELKFKSGDEFELNKNGRIRTAKLVRRDQIRMNSYVIFLNRDGNGKISELIVNNNRIRKVLFVPFDENFQKSES